MNYDFETRITVEELKGVLIELKGICIRAEKGWAWNNVPELRKELTEMKELIKHIDGKIKELEPKNKVHIERVPKMKMTMIYINR